MRLEGLSLRRNLNDFVAKIECLDLNVELSSDNDGAKALSERQSDRRGLVENKLVELDLGVSNVSIREEAGLEDVEDERVL